MNEEDILISVWKMGTVNTNLVPFQASSIEGRAFLRAVEVLNNSIERRIYILSANELVALLDDFIFYCKMQVCLDDFILLKASLS